MRFIYGESNTQEIKELLTNAGEIKCAVAFLGGDAADKYLINYKFPKIQIICNLESGATNPDAVRKIKNAYDNQSKCPPIITKHDLHAKVYWSPTKAIVTSANLSTNGMRDEEDTQGWLEAGIVLSKNDNPNMHNEINRWFDKLWEESLTNGEITEEKLKAAEVKRSQLPHINYQPILSSDKTYLMIYFDELDDAHMRELKNFYKVHKAIKHRSYDAYVECDNLLKLEKGGVLYKDTYFIDYYISEAGQAIYQGIYKAIGRHKQLIPLAKTTGRKQRLNNYFATQNDLTSFIKLHLPEFLKTRFYDGDCVCIPISIALEIAKNRNFCKDYNWDKEKVYVAWWRGRGNPSWKMKSLKKEKIKENYILESMDHAVYDKLDPEYKWQITFKMPPAGKVINPNSIEWLYHSQTIADSCDDEEMNTVVHLYKDKYNVPPFPMDKKFKEAFIKVIQKKKYLKLLDSSENRDRNDWWLYKNTVDLLPDFFAEIKRMLLQKECANAYT